MLFHIKMTSGDCDRLLAGYWSVWSVFFRSDEKEKKVKAICSYKMKRDLLSWECSSLYHYSCIHIISWRRNLNRTCTITRFVRRAIKSVEGSSVSAQQKLFLCNHMGCIIFICIPKCNLPATSLFLSRKETC